MKSRSIGISGAMTAAAAVTPITAPLAPQSTVGMSPRQTLASHRRFPISPVDR